MYLEDLIRDTARLETDADKELLKRERMCEKTSEMEYKERQRRLRLYLEHHRAATTMVSPRDIPEDKNGALYRRLLASYQENVSCIDDVAGYSIVSYNHLIISGTALFLLLFLTAMWLIFDDLSFHTGTAGPTVPITLFLTWLFYTIFYPFFNDYLAVKTPIRVAAECDVACSILEMRDRTLTFDDIDKIPRI